MSTEKAFSLENESDPILRLFEFANEKETQTLRIGASNHNCIQNPAEMQYINARICY
jgi:hypothetical protein